MKTLNRTLPRLWSRSHFKVENGHSCLTPRVHVLPPVLYTFRSNDKTGTNSVFWWSVWDVFNITLHSSTKICQVWDNPTFIEIAWDLNGQRLTNGQVSWYYECHNSLNNSHWSVSVTASCYLLILLHKQPLAVNIKVLLGLLEINFV